ncbi:peptidyl-prolyl cis-trans isomerase [Capsella rubella]|uniref:peptidyl-prolyl cis-trans isomerase n=1 Tax=Capsella rubella TaxID=81985 RepID=UPI000CD57D4D|nr:peptidyl-prolyl cis-trans isomerase [Capsella rubella]
MTQTSTDARLEALEKSHEKLTADTNARLYAIEVALSTWTAIFEASRATATNQHPGYDQYGVVPLLQHTKPSLAVTHPRSNPKVFFEFTVGGSPAGRIVMELYADTTPLTAENFRALCTGEKGIGNIFGKPLHYKGTIIDRICPGFMWCGGNIVRVRGEEGESIYGGVFPNENYIKRHDRPGVLSMAVGDPHTNASQFQIVLEEFSLLDGVHVVFGQVIEGFDVIRRIEDEVASTRNRIPSKPVVIADCGQL